MIRVELAPEPEDFGQKVRQKGLDAIAELVGEIPSNKRRGPKRKKLADSREKIPSDKFPPFWRDALDDMLDSYSRICAYMCVYIERITGAPTVDHVVAKSRTWDQVYEWSNFRLACSAMNSRKGVIPDLLDPMKIQNGWFTVEFVEFQVIPAEHLDDKLWQQVDDTITKLGLNDFECTRLRETYVEDYKKGDISFDYLRKRAPFLVMELERQGHLVS